jgi:hypothetical protein
MAMGKCEDSQRKFYTTQTNCKHSEGGYGRLPLGDICTCHGFLLKTSKFEKVKNVTFIYNLIEGFVDGGFGDPWEPLINKIYGTQ